MRHDLRKFVEKVDFITTPEYLDGPGGRERAGLPPGSGPYRLVSNLAVMGYHPENQCVMLIVLQPGVSIEQVVENTGFELLIAPDVAESPPPSAEELYSAHGSGQKSAVYIDFLELLAARKEDLI
jgi:glutaconate CoA-transferase subunit B